MFARVHEVEHKRRFARILNAAFDFAKERVTNIRTVSSRISETGRKLVSSSWELVVPVPKVVRIGLPSAMVVLVAILLFLTPSEEYSDLARIEIVPYIPISVKGATETETSFDEGMSFYNEGKYSEAIEKLESVLEKKPGRVNTRLYLGLCYLLNNNVDKAIEHLTRAIELGGNSLLEICHWYLGNAYLLKEDGEKALEEFKKVWNLRETMNGKQRK